VPADTPIDDEEPDVLPVVVARDDPMVRPCDFPFVVPNDLPVVRP